MDIAEIEAELAGLELSSFDEGTALRLGNILIDMAKVDQLPVVINIRSVNRTFFHAALAGSAPLHEIWARRKSNIALTFHEPSLLVGLRHKEKGESLAKHGLDPAEFADHGGAVPIRVAGAGVVAVATVSGLPQVEDHKLVVRGIKALLAG
jgi:uncharacterized protein (UPF0303 family)